MIGYYRRWALAALTATLMILCIAAVGAAAPARITLRVTSWAWRKTASRWRILRCCSISVMELSSHRQAPL
jgi:hypothetical protein